MRFFCKKSCVTLSLILFFSFFAGAAFILAQEQNNCRVLDLKFSPQGIFDSATTLPKKVDLKIQTAGCIDKTIKIFIFGNSSEEGTVTLKENKDLGIKSDTDLDDIPFLVTKDDIELKFEVNDDDGNGDLAVYNVVIEQVGKSKPLYDTHRRSITLTTPLKEDLKKRAENRPDKEEIWKRLDELTEIKLNGSWNTKKIDLEILRLLGVAGVIKPNEILAFPCGGICYQDWQLLDYTGIQPADGSGTRDCVTSASFDPSGPKKEGDFPTYEDGTTKDTMDVKLNFTVKERCVGSVLSFSVGGIGYEDSGGVGIDRLTFEPVRIDNKYFKITGQNASITLSSGEDGCSVSCSFGFVIGNFSSIDESGYTLKEGTTISYPCILDTKAGETEDNKCTAEKERGWRIKEDTLTGAVFYDPSTGTPVSGQPQGDVYTGEYTFLEPLPGFCTDEQLAAGTCKIDTRTGFGDYLNRIITFVIMVAGVLAVLMIVIGGIRWTLEESVFEKGEAKKMISNALFGLVLVLASYMILNTINPNLVDISIAIESADVDEIVRESAGGDYQTSLTPLNKADLQTLGINCQGSGGTTQLAAIAESFKDRVTYNQDKRGTYDSREKTIFLDCSSYIYNVYVCAGLKSPGNWTGDIFATAPATPKPPVEYKDEKLIDADKKEYPLHVGDLLGWKKGESKNSDEGHVVMYIGKGEIIEVAAPKNKINQAVKKGVITKYRNDIRYIERASAFD